MSQSIFTDVELARLVVQSSDVWLSSVDLFWVIRLCDTRDDRKEKAERARSRDQYQREVERWGYTVSRPVVLRGTYSLDDFPRRFSMRTGRKYPSTPTESFSVPLCTYARTRKYPCYDARVPPSQDHQRRIALPTLQQWRLPRADAQLRPSPPASFDMLCCIILPPSIWRIILHHPAENFTQEHLPPIGGLGHDVKVNSPCDRVGCRESRPPVSSQKN